MSVSSRLEVRRLARFEAEHRAQAARPPVPDDERWNHHIHYHRVLLDAVPAGCRCALDLGCGEGHFTRRLAARTRHAVGMDRDGPSIELARVSSAAANVDYVAADLLHPPFAPASFDAVFCLMALHHVDAEAGLARMVELLRPGGVLGIIGLARAAPRDFPWDGAGFVLTRLHRLTKGEWMQPAPMCWPPPTTYRDMQRMLTTALPGSRYRRRVLFRYTVLWTKP